MKLIELTAQVAVNHVVSEAHKALLSVHLLDKVEHESA